MISDEVGRKPLSSNSAAQCARGNSWGTAMRLLSGVLEGGAVGGEEQGGAEVWEEVGFQELDRNFGCRSVTASHSLLVSTKSRINSLGMPALIIAVYCSSPAL
jgi:hypothetical protein